MSQIIVKKDIIEVQRGTEAYTLPRGKLPEEFIQWEIEQRKAMLESIQSGTMPTFMASHLPTLITVDLNRQPYGVNAASKGVGLVPIESKLETLIAQIQQADPTQAADFRGTIKQRMQALMLFYANPQLIDQKTLGGLEIFESQSYANMHQNPCVSLFFVGEAPKYPSFQINCVAEILPQDHVFYRFVSTVRGLFEQARFHFQQPTYPYAIRYHVIEVLDKTLRMRKP